jgi:TATA element modulatory factor
MDLSQSGGSAWGGFLKKAMEGVEQQLDRVLENPPPKGIIRGEFGVIVAIARDAAKLKDAITPPGVQAPSRTGSGNSRMTLQERLAASVAKSRTGSPKIVTSATEDSTGESVKISGESMRETNGSGTENGSVETVQIETSDVPIIPVRTETPAIREPLELPSRTETPDLQAIPGDEESTQPSPSQLPPTIAPKPILPPEVAITTEILIPPEPSTPILPSPTRTSSARPSTSQPPSSLPSDTDPGTADLISQLRSDLATCESRRIEESQQSTLRISSLEEKLKLLTEITRHRSKEIVADTTESAWERKLADREEKIALLLDEGPSLPVPISDLCVLP